MSHQPSAIGASRQPLRAYLCSKATCSLMGHDLAMFTAEFGRVVEMFPGDWLWDLRKCPDAWRESVREDRALIEELGLKDLPIIVDGIRVITEADWNGYLRELRKP